MKLKMRYTALLAALILALGLIAMPRAGAAGGDDYLELLQPPGGENGDPDGPTPVFFVVSRLHFTGSVLILQFSPQNMLRSAFSRARVMSAPHSSRREPARSRRR